jgi:hypothetical protein
VPAHVKAAQVAVHALALAISRYAEHVRRAAASARAAAREAEAGARQITEQRHQELTRAIQVLDQAQAALDRCRRDCGPLINAVVRARQVHKKAERDYQQAVKAAEIIRAANRELSAAISTAEPVVSGQSSGATAALADLAQRLQEITGASHAAWLENMTGGVTIAISVAAAGHPAGIPARPYVVPSREEATAAQQAKDYGAEQMRLLAERGAAPEPSRGLVGALATNRVEEIIADVLALADPLERFEQFLRRIWLLQYDEPSLNDVLLLCTESGSAIGVDFCERVSAFATRLMRDAQTADAIRRDITLNEVYRLIRERGSAVRAYHREPSTRPSRADYEQQLDVILNGLLSARPSGR